MKTNDRISVVLTCDNFYVILLAALLKSIELNHLSDEIVDVYLVSDEITKSNKERVAASITSTKMNLIWLEMGDVIPEGITLPIVNNAYPVNIHLRLLIPHFMPKEVEKVIYMDVDMIMLGDISTLWGIDIGDYVVGAVSDTIGPGIKKIPEGIENWEELGLDPEENYFNSGMLVMNRTKWLEQEITQKTFQAINNNKKYAFLADQYGLNVALIGNWYQIDKTWNYFTVGTDPKPGLIHYFHKKPIFKSYKYNYKDEFYYYLRKTEWKDFQPIGESSRYIKKIGNMLEKLKLFLTKN
jgi:lipopolysaccharide biosynthesis glycosyltransferase